MLHDIGKLPRVTIKNIMEKGEQGVKSKKVKKIGK